MAAIRQIGLLPASALLELFGIEGEARRLLEEERRPTGITLHHPAHGTATINDNAPLQTAALAACLDGGLTPADWMRELNRRVFFWPDREAVTALLNAPLNRHRDRAVLTIDTLSLASRHASRVELSPINSGSTMRKPARRGPATFTPLGAHPLTAWRALRGGRDRIREVTIVGPVPDIADHIVAVDVVPGRASPLRPRSPAPE